MWSGKCRCGVLCPFSFGIALAITYALAVLCFGVALMHGYVPDFMPTTDIVMTWPLLWKMLAYAFVKGFIFGFVLILIYDFISGCLKRCCKGASCGCDKPDTMK